MEPTKKEAISKATNYEEDLTVYMAFSREKTTVDLKGSSSLER